MNILRIISYVFQKILLRNDYFADQIKMPSTNAQVQIVQQTVRKFFLGVDLLYHNIKGSQSKPNIGHALISIYSITC